MRATQLVDGGVVGGGVAAGRQRGGGAAGVVGSPVRHSKKPRHAAGASRGMSACARFAAQRGGQRWRTCVTFCWNARHMWG